MLKKAHHLWSTDRVVVDLHVQLSRRRDGTDDVEMVVATRGVDHRRLANRSPSAYTRRQQVEAGFVYPDEGSLFVGSFFLINGQVSSRQRSIASSLRSRARSTGCWTLQPIWRNRRPIWS